jgi:hypothetical protein
MLKSSPISKRNGAHWCKKKRLKKTRTIHILRFKCFEHAKTFFYLCQALKNCVNFAINGKYSQKIMTI